MKENSPSIITSGTIETMRFGGIENFFEMAHTDNEGSLTRPLGSFIVRCTCNQEIDWPSKTEYANESVPDEGERLSISFPPASDISFRERNLITVDTSFTVPTARDSTFNRWTSSNCKRRAIFRDKKYSGPPNWSARKHLFRAKK